MNAILSSIQDQEAYGPSQEDIVNQMRRQQQPPGNTEGYGPGNVPQDLRSDIAEDPQIRQQLLLSVMSPSQQAGALSDPITGLKLGSVRPQYRNMITPGSLGSMDAMSRAEALLKLARDVAPADLVNKEIDNYNNQIPTNLSDRDRYIMAKLQQVGPKWMEMEDSAFKNASGSMSDLIRNNSPLLGSMLKGKNISKEDIKSLLEAAGQLNGPSNRKGSRLRSTQIKRANGQTQPALFDNQTGNVFTQDSNGNLQNAPNDSTLLDPSRIDASNKKNLVKNILEYQQEAQQLQSIMDTMDPEALTFKGKALKMLAEVRSKAGMATEEDIERLSRQIPFLNKINTYFALKVKFISGASVAAAEFDRLKRAFINEGMAPDTFLFALKGIMKEVSEAIRLNKEQLIGDTDYTMNELFNMDTKDWEKRNAGYISELTQSLNDDLPRAFKMFTDSNGRQPTDKELNKIADAMQEKLKNKHFKNGNSAKPYHIPIYEDFVASDSMKRKIFGL